MLHQWALVLPAVFETCKMDRSGADTRHCKNMVGKQRLLRILVLETTLDVLNSVIGDMKDSTLLSRVLSI